MATKIPIAQKRMFHNVYVCKNCNKKVRSPSVRVVAGFLVLGGKAAPLGR